MRKTFLLLQLHLNPHASVQRYASQYMLYSMQLSWYTACVTVKVRCLFPSAVTRGPQTSFSTSCIPAASFQALGTSWWSLSSWSRSKLCRLDRWGTAFSWCCVVQTSDVSKLNIDGNVVDDPEVIVDKFNEYVCNIGQNFVACHPRANDCRRIIWYCTFFKE